jgi:hypothetical protein
VRRSLIGIVAMGKVSFNLLLIRANECTKNTIGNWCSQVVGHPFKYSPGIMLLHLRHLIASSVESGREIGSGHIPSHTPCNLPFTTIIHIVQFTAEKVNTLAIDI